MRLQSLTKNEALRIEDRPIRERCCFPLPPSQQERQGPSDHFWMLFDHSFSFKAVDQFFLVLRMRIALLDKQLRPAKVSCAASWEINNALDQKVSEREEGHADSLVFRPRAVESP